MRKALIIIFGLLVIGGGVWGWRWWNARVNPKGEDAGVHRDMFLQKYDFNELKKRGGVAGEIEILGDIKEIKDRRTYDVDFDTRQFRFKSGGKLITGMINYHPERSSLSPVVIMIRGYADKPGYYSGSGSWRMADQLAKGGLPAGRQGFATFSVDFLGYAGSDGESTDMLEARFEKVVSVLDLIASVKALPWVDKNKVGIWAHSNGGQIALSVLEVTGENYPTVLWAPMTNPFPQSVLDTANDLDDGGKAVRQVIADFEKYYDSRRYAFENYYSWINAPVLILQGTSDEWCKVEWQEKVIGGLKEARVEAKLSVYQGNDHNLSKDWEEAVEETKGWYRF